MLRDPSTRGILVAALDTWLQLAATLFLLVSFIDGGSMQRVLIALFVMAYITRDYLKPGAALAVESPDMDGEEPGETQRPDYVAACLFLQFVSRYALIVVVAIVAINTTSLLFWLLFFPVLYSSDVFWDVLAQYFRKRRGEAAHSVKTVLGQNLLFWSITALAGWFAAMLTANSFAVLAIVTAGQIIVYPAVANVFTARHSIA